MDQLVGRELHGKWRIDELLATGGMAAVYAATDRDGAEVAVKVMHHELARDPVLRRRFLREAHAASRARHPAVVRPLADGELASGEPFLVFDLLGGIPLHDVIEDEAPFTIDRALAIADQLLDALVVAHAAGVLHRDLKPDNMLLDGDRLKVLDWGIAFLADQSEADGLRLTVQGHALGTPGFMAPEQARGDLARIDARTDVWAVGATLFAMLSGRAVVMAQRAEEALVLAATTPAPRLDTVVEIDPEVAELVDRALAFAPADRWPSAAAMHAEVRRLRGLPAAPLAASDVTSPTADTGYREAVDTPDEPLPHSLVPIAHDPPADPPRPRQRVLLFAAAALMLATGALIMRAEVAAGAPAAELHHHVVEATTALTGHLLSLR